MVTVSRLSISPVKSLALLHPESIELTEHGVAEDRRFFLVDATGRLIDALLVGSLVQVGAWTDLDGSVLRITLPDGTVVEDTVRPAEPIVSSLYGRTVHGNQHRGQSLRDAHLEGIHQRAGDLYASTLEEGQGANTKPLARDRGDDSCAHDLLERLHHVPALG